MNKISEKVILTILTVLIFLMSLGAFFIKSLINNIGGNSNINIVALYIVIFMAPVWLIVLFFIFKNKK